jgi:hypothetical protein
MLEQSRPLVVFPLSSRYPILTGTITIIWPCKRINKYIKRRETINPE